MMQSATIGQFADEAGFRVHERAQESWRAVFEMLGLTSRFAGLTRAQTARSGLDVLGDEGPVAVLKRIDNAIEHLECLVELLEFGRHGVELAIAGAVGARRQAPRRRVAGRRAQRRGRSIAGRSRTVAPIGEKKPRA